MTQLEIVVPPNFDGTFRIKVDPLATAATITSTITPGTPTTPASTAAGGVGSAPWSANVDKMLVRMEKNGKTSSWPHRDIANHLLAAGFTPEARPAGKAYVKWHVDGKARGLTVYQEGSNLVVDSKPLLAFVLTLPGAKKTLGERPRVSWPFGASVDNALNAATQLRAYADQ